MRAMTRARLALAGFLIVVTMGCVSLPEQQAFNRAAHADIRDIGVLERNRPHCTSPCSTTRRRVSD